MKRNLVFVTLAMFLGFAISAVPAMAQVQFTVAGGNQVVRGEGHTETVNAVTLTNPTSTSTIAAGTSVNFDYSATVTNAPASGSGFASPSNVSAVLNGAACALAACANLREDVSSNRITLTFIAAQAIVPGDSITLTGVRVDVAALGSVSTVNVTLSSTPASAGITYNPTSVPVAVVINPSIKVKYTATTSGVLTCNPPTVVGVSSFSVKVTELTQGAFATLTEEQANTPIAVALPAVTNGTQIIVVVSGVPASLNVHFDGFSSVSGVVVGAPTSSDITSKGGTDTQKFVFPVTTDTAGLDDVTFAFSLYLKGSNTLNLGAATVAATTFLGPVGDVASTPSTTASLLFKEVDYTSNVDSVADCVTNLLFPWVAVDAPGGTFDTGMALANTTKDVFDPNNGGATAQTGSCALTGFQAADGTTVTTTVGPIAAGETGTVVLSTVSGFAGFRGYVFAICAFQNGHGFAFITQDNATANGTSQGYLGLIIPTPSLANRSPAGGGLGESLGN